MIPQTLLETRRKFARSVMFWLGVFYLVVSVHGMTPYTFQLDDIKITLVHLLGPILIVAYVFFLAKKWVDPPRPLVFVPFLLYMGVMILSTLFAVDYAKWVGWQMTLFQWALLGPYLAFMVGCSDIDGARRGLKLFMLILLGSTLFGLAHRIGVAGLLYQAYKNDPSSYHGQDPSFMLKMSATFASAQNEMMSIILNRDFYGCFLALTIPMAIGVLLLARKAVWQAIAILTIALAAICLLLTNSKDSWVATGTAIGIVGFLYIFVARLRIRHRRQILMMGAALAVALIVVGFFTRGMLLQQIKSVGISLSSREIIWGGAVGMWKDNPILGAGPGSYRMFFPLYRRPDYFLYDISHVTISAHNYFLDLLGDTGALGFITFMSFLGILYWKNLRHVRLHPNRDHRVASMCLLAGLTGFFLNAITSPCPRWAVGAVNLWSALGMLAGMIQYPVIYGKSKAESTAPGEERYSRTEGMARQQTVHVAETASAASIFAPLRAYQSPVAWTLLIICTGLGIYSATWGINFFRSAMLNNEGVTLLGDESRPGPIGQLRGKIDEERKQLSNPNLSVADQQKYEQELSYYSSLFDENRDKAIEYFEGAARIAPSSVTSIYKLASLYSMGSHQEPREEDFRKALEGYEQIQHYWPEYSQTPYNIGAVYLGLSNFAASPAERDALIDKALKYFKQAVAMSIEPDINSFYIRLLLQNANEGTNPMKAMERKAEALRVAKRLMTEWDRTLGYVSIPKDPGKPNQPAYELRNSVRKSLMQQQQIILSVADIYATVARAVNDREASIKGLKRLRELTPGDESVIVNMIGQYREMNDNKNLKRLVDDVLAENPLNLRARFWLGAVSAESGDIREAKRQALILKKIDSGFPESEFLLFLIYERAGKVDMAKQYAVSYLKEGSNAERKQAAVEYLKKHNSEPLGVLAPATSSEQKPAEQSTARPPAKTDDVQAGKPAE